MAKRRLRYTLRQLEVAVAVADHANVTHAADRLGVSQPAVTRTIAEIEAEVGAALFDRTPRGMLLTVFGESFVRHAKAVLSELHHAGEEIEALKGNDIGAVRVGTTPIGSSYLMPLAAARLVEKHPGLRVEILEESYSSLLSDLRTGALDLVVGPATEEATDTILRAVPLFTDEFVIIASKGHRLAGRGPLPLSALVEERWVLPPQNNSLWRRLAGWFAANDLPMPRRSVLSASSALVKAMMAQGEWLTVYPRLIVQADIAEGRLSHIPVEGPRVKWDVVVHHRSTSALSPATQAMQKELAAIAEELRGARAKA